MRLVPMRFTVRRLMLLVAIAAVPLAFWAAWFDPVRRWKWAVNDAENGAGRYAAVCEIAYRHRTVDNATALATLSEALRSPSYGVRETALVGLDLLGPAARPAAPALIEALADPEPSVRAGAAANLGSLLSPGDARRNEAVPALRRLLRDRSRDVRLAAASTLVRFGHGAETVPALVAALRQPDYMSQTDALWTLACIGPPAAVALPEVIALQSRAEAYVAPDLSRFLRVYAAQTRCHLGDGTAGLASLHALANSPDASLAQEARRALSRIPNEIRDEL